MYSAYTVKWASLNWEIEQARQLRQRVFCQEQKVFEQQDMDEIDDYAQCLVAIAHQGGWHDRVVGTVRIHPDLSQANVWWGSRLAVDAEFRTHSGIGAYLIRLAVGSAHALGCQQFFAHVQKQNERLFQRVGWDSQHEEILHGHRHVAMQAQLENFPPCHTPYSGFVINHAPHQDTGLMVEADELAPHLLALPTLTHSDTFNDIARPTL